MRGLLMALLAFSFANQIPDDPATPIGTRLTAAEVKESYRVYSYLLRQHLPAWKSGETVAVNRETWKIGPRTLKPSCIEPQGPVASLYQSLIADFTRLNEARYVLDDKFSIDRDHILISGADADAVGCAISCAGTNGCEMPCALSESDRTRFKNVTTRVSFSMVAFDPDRTHALVYFDWHCGMLCGRGTFYLLAQTRGKWGPAWDYQGPPPCLWFS